MIETVNLIQVTLDRGNKLSEFHSTQLELFAGMVIDLWFDQGHSVIFYVLRDQDDNEISVDASTKADVLKEVQEWFESHVELLYLEEYYEVEGEEDPDVFYYGHQVFSEVKFLDKNN